MAHYKASLHDAGIGSSGILHNSSARDFAQISGTVLNKTDRIIGTSKEPVINERNFYDSSLHQRMSNLAFSGVRETYRGNAQTSANLDINPVNENRFFNNGVQRRTRTQKLAGLAQNQKQGGLKLPYAARNN